MLGVRIDAKGVVVARILGVRHLTQALVSSVRPSPAVLATGVWIDAVHSVTALALARADRDRVRPGLIDAAVAASWAIAGHWDLARHKHTERHVREQAASKRRETLAT